MRMTSRAILLVFFSIAVLPDVVADGLQDPGFTEAGQAKRNGEGRSGKYRRLRKSRHWRLFLECRRCPCTMRSSIATNEEKSMRLRYTMLAFAIGAAIAAGPAAAGGVATQLSQAGTHSVQVVAESGQAIGHSVV